MADSRQRFETWEGFLRAHASITKQLDAELVAEHELTLSEYDVLYQISRCPDGQLRPTEIAEEVLLTRSGITRLLARLERQGLVERCPCTEDGRVTYASITDAGRTKVHDAARTHRRGISELFAERITEQEARKLAGVFGRLVTPG